MNIVRKTGVGLVRSAACLFWLVRSATRLFLPLALKIDPELEPWAAARVAAQMKAPWPNLEGDRSIEWSWVVTRMANGPGRALDFGCGISWLGLVAARKGYEVTAIDLTNVNWPYVAPGMRFIRGDILKAGHKLKAGSFDLIINCSSIEHVGLSGRYGSAADSEGDLRAMAIMRGLLKPGGKMLLTLPIGKDAVFAPLHRVYGSERLPRLLGEWSIGEREYWIKDSQNRWIVVDESAALEYEPSQYCYGLGCFVLSNGSA